MPSLELKVGDSHELVLRGLGAAGYSWQVEVSGQEGVLEIERSSSGAGADAAAAAAEGGPPPASGSLPEIVRVVARSEGRARLRLVLRRSWEVDTPPIDEADYDVVVTG